MVELQYAGAGAWPSILGGGGGTLVEAGIIEFSELGAAIDRPVYRDPADRRMPRSTLTSAFEIARPAARHGFPIAGSGAQ